MRYRPRRKHTDFSAVLLSDAGPQQVVLRDVSATGMRATGLTGYVAPQAEVQLKIRDRSYDAVVIWARDRSVGLKFNRPLPADLNALVTRSLRG